jgi:hypothetical protein
MWRSARSGHKPPISSASRGSWQLAGLRSFWGPVAAVSLRDVAGPGDLRQRRTHRGAAESRCGGDVARGHRLVVGERREHGALGLTVRRSPNRLPARPGLRPARERSSFGFSSTRLRPYCGWFVLGNSITTTDRYAAQAGRRPDRPFATGQYHQRRPRLEDVRDGLEVRTRHLLRRRRGSRITCCRFGRPQTASRSLGPREPMRSAGSVLVDPEAARTSSEPSASARSLAPSLQAPRRC